MTRPLSLISYQMLMNCMRPLLPFYLKQRAARGKEDPARLQERYGLGYAPLAHDGPAIWLHGVSVGEIRAALALADALYRHFPDAQFIITTGTVTAAEMVAQQADHLPVTHYYAPFDAPAFVTRFFASAPFIFGVIFESDFWPALIDGAHQAGIPLYLASAQMSESSAANWQKLPALAKAIFAPITAAFVHDDVQKKRFQSLGTTDVHITGSLKLVSALRKATPFAKALKEAAKGRFILLGASTHKGEEAQLLALSQHLNALGQDHLLIIAPRHPNRGDEIAALLGQTKRRSLDEMPARNDSYYLCDGLGDMPSLYQAADIVWLGATFSGKGGHNPIEAASYGKSVICGPSHYKNQLEFDNLLAADVCHEIGNPAMAASFIMTLRADKARMAAIAKAGKAYAQKAAKRPAEVAKLIATHHKQASS